MQTVEFYRRKIKNAEDLQSIVHTMKVLASVSIRQFERSAESLGEYFRTVEMGLQVVLDRSLQQATPFLESRRAGRAGIIVLGSSQGLCGTFDEQIYSFCREQLRDNAITEPLFLAMGERIAARLEQHYHLEEVFELPGSVNGLNSTALRLLLAVNTLRTEKEVDQFLIIHHKPLKQGRFLPRIQYLLPLDRHWLNRIAEKEWPTNNLPQFTMNSDQLFSNLVRQYLLVSLYRAMAESLAAEHTSRLNAMSVAEQKIEEHLMKLHNQYAQERQNAITEELLDILSGYRAVSEEQ